MVNTKVIAVANQKGGVDKSTSVYCIGAGLAAVGHKVLLVDVDLQGDLTKMLGRRKPHEIPLTLANKMNDVVAGIDAAEHPEVMHHAEGFDFVPANRTLSAVEVGLVNVMSQETVLRQYLDTVKKNYDYVLLELRQKDKDYEQVHEQFYTMEEQYPFIKEVLEGKGRITLTAEEHTILLDYLDLYRKMDKKERIHIYFRGHTDALAYLTKTGMV